MPIVFQVGCHFGEPCSPQRKQLEDIEFLSRQNEHLRSVLNLSSMQVVFPKGPRQRIDRWLFSMAPDHAILSVTA